MRDRARRWNRRVARAARDLMVDPHLMNQHRRSVDHVSAGGVCGDINDGVPSGSRVPVILLVELAAVLKIANSGIGRT